MKIFTRSTAVFGNKSFNKLVSALGLIIMLLFSAVSFGQAIVTFPTTWSGTPATVNATTVAANINTPVTASRGVGLTAVSSSARFNSSGWSGGSTLTLASNTSYLTFTVTAATGYTLNLNSSTLSFALGSSGTGPQIYGIYTSVGGFTSTTNQIGSDLTTTSTSVTFPSTGYSSLSTIEIRIYGWNASTPATGTGGFSSLGLTGTVNVSGITSFQTGNWSSTSTWVGGVVPSSSANAIIATGHTVTMDVTTGGINTRNSGTTTTVNTGGTLATAVQYINNGTFLVNGTFQLNSSGSITGTGPLYASSSLLKYNTAANPQGRGVEWGLNSSGTSGTTAGYPFNVQLSNNTTFNYPNSANYTANQIAGSLTVDAGSNFYMDYGSPASNGALSVLGNVIFNGNVTLGNASGGDLNVRGNWTRTAATSTFNANNRAVTFNGSGTQVIALAVAGTQSFPFLITGGSGTVQFSSSPATSVTVTGGNGLTLGSSNAISNIDLNGQTLTLNGGGNLSVGNATRNITSSTGTGTLTISTTGLTVTNTTPGKLITGNNVLVSVSTSLNFGSGITTIGGGTSGTLQLNSGYGVSNIPFYAAGSLLQYNSGGSPGRSTEWTLNSSGTSGTTAGYPSNVQISNTTTLNYPNGTYTANQIAGSLTIDANSNFYMDFGSPASNGILTVIGSVTANGNLSLGNTTNGDLVVRGSWTKGAGTFDPKTRTVTFNGASAQTIAGATGFYNLTINNTSGGVSTSAANTVSNVLTLTSGIFTSSTSLGVTNTANTAISGGSATSFVNGPLTRSLPNSSSANYIFPIGATATYLPFAITNPGGTSPVVTMQAFAANTGGTFDATLQAISAAEYWSGTLSGSLSAGTVSAAKASIGSSTAIGKSSTLSGVYTSLGGTTNSTLITSSTITSTTATGTTLGFFVLATPLTQYYSKSTGSLNSTSTWTTDITLVAGTAPADFVTAGQVFNIRNQATPTIAATWTVSGTGSKVILGDATLSAINFTVPSGFAFTGTIDIAASSSGSNTLTLQNTTIPTFGTLNAGSTVDYNGTAITQAITAITYGNLTLSGTGTRTFPAGTVGIAGTFTPGTFTTATQGTINFSSATTQTIPAFTYFNLTNTGNGVRTMPSGTVGVAGTTFTPGTGAYTFNAANTVNFSNGTGFTIPTPTAAATNNYNNLTISGAGAYSFASSITLGGNYLQNAAATVTLNNGATVYNLTAAGNFNLSAGTFAVQNTSTGLGSTVTINGATGTTISGTGSLLMDNGGAAVANRSIFQTINFTASSTSTSPGIIDFGSSAITKNNEFRISGSCSKTGATGKFFTTESVVNGGLVFNGSGSTQTVSIVPSSTAEYYNVTVNSNAVVQLTTVLTLGSSTVPTSTMTVNGTLDCQALSPAVNGGATNGTFTLASGGNIRMANPNGLQSGTTGSISTSIGTRNYSSLANYVFNGATGQSTGTFTTTPTTNTVATYEFAGAGVVNNTYGTSITCTTLRLTSGTLNVGSGNTINISTTGSVVATSGNFNSSSAGTINFAGTGTVTGTVDFYPAVTQTPGASVLGVTYSSGSTIRTSLQLNQNSFVNTTAPSYAAGSTLIYNTGGGFTAGTEWTAGATSGAGVPANIQIGNGASNSSLVLPNNTYTLTGNFTFFTTTSAAFTMNAGGGTLNIGGNWANNTTNVANFTRGGGTVVFNGSGAQSFGGSNVNTGGYAFNSLTINNSSGTSTGVTLTKPVTVAGTFTLTLGLLNTDATNILNITNTTAGAVVGGSTTSFVNGPINRALGASINSGTFSYPVGAGSTYLPLTLVNPTTGATGPVVQATAFNSNSGGNVTGSVILSSISPTEYWQLAVNSGDFTNGAVNITRQSALGSLNVIGRSTTVSGTYASIGGSPSGTTISGTASSIGAIAAASSNFFVMATAIPAPVISSFTPGSGFSGTSIGITGTDFTNVSNVTIGGTVASFVFNSATSITVVAGAGTTGTIAVTTPAGTGTSSGSFSFGGYITTADGDWNTPGTWLNNSLPPAGATATINHVVTVNSPVTNAVASITVNSTKSLTFNTGAPSTGTLTTTNLTNNGSVVMTNGGTLTIANGGTFANSINTFTAGTGTVAFAGAGTISGTISFNSLTLNGATTLPSTVTIIGNLTFNAATTSVSNAPTYGASSNLIYAASVPRGGEWSTTSGAGYPVNVTVQNGASLTANQSFDIGCSGNLQLGSTGTAGSIGMAGSGKIIVAGNVTIGSNSGTSNLSLSSTSGGDIKVGGNWTRTANGSFTPNTRAVFFTGSGTNIINSTSGASFDYLVSEKTAGSIQLGSNLTVNAPGGGNALSLKSAAGFDLNANTLSLSNNVASNIQADGGAVNFTGTGTISFTSATKTISAINTGSIVFGSNVALTTSTGVNFGAGLSTVNGTLQINAGGFVQTNAPAYGSSSTLIYNSGGTYGRGTEWSTTTGAGYPANVQIGNGVSTILDVVNGTLSYKRASGILTVNTGSTFSVPALTSGNGSGVGVEFLGNIINDGTISLNTGANTTSQRLKAANLTNGNSNSTAVVNLSGVSGGDLELTGNYLDNAVFNANTRAVFFTGIGTQTIGGTATAPFNIDYIVVTKASGFVQLLTSLLTGAPNTGNALTLTSASDILDLNGNTFTLGTSGLASTVSGSGLIRGSSSSSMVINGTGALGTVNFETGNRTLANLTVNRTSTGSVTLGTDLTVATAVTFTDGAFNISANILTLNGTVARSTGTIGASTGTVTFNGASAQSVPASIFTSDAVNNVNISNASGVTFNGSAVVSGTLTVNGLFTPVAAAIISGAGTLTGTGTIQVTRATGTADLTGQYSIANRTLSNLTTEYIGAAAQGVTGITFGGLKISNSNGVNLAGVVNVNGTLNLNTGLLTIGTNTLTLNGATTRTSGALVGSNTSNLVIGGTAINQNLFFDQTTNTFNNYLKDFTLSSAATATLSNALNIAGGAAANQEGTLTVTPGTAVLTTGGNLTIKSNINGTARIATGNTGGGYISGVVSVERFIQKFDSKGWRLLASNTIGQSINAAWQEGGAGTAADPNPGFGTMIAVKSNTFGNNLTTAKNNGFDAFAQGSSLLIYNKATDNLDPVIDNTKTRTISDSAGYFIFIRGDRAEGGHFDPVYPSTAPTTTTVLRSKGSLFMGDQTAVSTGAQGWALVRNPYPSRIDMRNIVRNPNLVAAYQVWDPKLTSVNGVGAYETFTRNPVTGNYEIGVGGGSYATAGTVNNYIESGSAFFIQANSGVGTAQVVEACKNLATGSAVVNRPLAAAPRFYYSLFANNNTPAVLDGGYIDFSASYTNEVDILDVRKSPNFGENFGPRTANTDLVVERRTLITATDTFFYKISGMRAMDYQLSFTTDGLDNTGLIAILEDKFLGSSTPVNLSGTTTYNFTVNATAASKAADRFRIVFKAGNPLPVTFTNIKATEQGNNVAVEWKVASQLNVASYEVEKSTDGRSFNRVATQMATGVNNANSTYNWLDVHAISGTNYYRVKAIDVNGAAKYTQIVKITLGKVGTGFTVSPNPVKGNSFTLQISNEVTGQYEVRLVNITGQILYKKIIQHAGGNASQLITLPSQTISGVYQLEVFGPDKTKQAQKLLIDNTN